MDILIQAAQLIFSLSILVILHEFGHYIPAKLFGTRIEKFYLFFDPWFSLYKKKIGETEWGIGWLPLGGYVKISGMIDESMDTEQMKKPAEPWEFRSKPAWQRLIIMIGGVTVNVITGIVIYIGISYYYGATSIDKSKLEHGYAIHPLFNQFGIESGDIIDKVDGKYMEDFTEVNKSLLLRGGKQLEVIKPNGEKKQVTLPEKFEYTMFQQGAINATMMRSQLNGVDSVLANSAAQKMGLKKGDKILTINQQSIVFFDDLQKALYSSRNKKADFEILRGADTLHMSTKIDETGTVGIQNNSELLDKDALYTKKISFGEAIPKGFELAKNTLGDYAGQMKFLFTKKGASSLGGFATMGKLFPKVWNWEIFWATTAFISLVLAFMNILPIPALDGGHIVFLIYEMITGKEAPQKVLEVAQTIGIVLLIGLMLYANGNDLFRSFIK